MNEFLKETRKREIESCRVDNFKRKSRKMNQCFYDQMESLEIIFSLIGNEGYKIIRNNYFFIIRENMRHHLFSSYNIRNWAPYNLYSPYSYIQRELTIKKIKGNKINININYRLSIDILKRLENFKSVKIISGIYENNIVISHLKNVIEYGVLYKIITLIANPIIKSEEENDCV
ncbi:hypothetical protein D3C87_79000 [compost metagenome]